MAETRCLVTHVENIVIPATNKTPVIQGQGTFGGSLLLFYPSQSCRSWLSSGSLPSSPLPTQSGSPQQPPFLHTFQLKSLEVTVSGSVTLTHAKPIRSSLLTLFGIS